VSKHLQTIGASALFLVITSIGFASPLLAQSGGTTYYVSNSGSDSNSGTSTSSPWKTISKVQNFLGSLRPGDSVLFQRGGVWNEMLNAGVDIVGTSSARITFGNYGSGNLPIIDGGGRSSGRASCMSFTYAKFAYVTVDGFECRNTSAYGINFNNLNAGSVGAIVQNTYIHDTANGDTGYHNQLQWFDWTQNTSSGGTKFLNNKVGNCYGHNCIQIDGDRNKPLIQGNECYGWSHNCIDVKRSQGVVVDQNVVHDGLGVQQYSEAYYLESSGVSWVSDITWTRNIAYGGGIGSAFQCQDAGAPVTCYMYNNTVLSGSAGIYGGADSGNTSNVSIYVKNNIFDLGSPRGGSGYAVWDYNDNVQSSAIGSHDMRVSPMYMNAGAHDYHLQSASPVIDKGTNVGFPYSGPAPDLGAFETGSQTVPPPASRAVDRDFNGDGKADIVWRQSGGAVAVWLLNGSSVIGQGSPGGAGTDWAIAGVGDFNGDGRSDILWRQKGGTVAVWFLNGSTIIGSGSPGGAGADWTIAGVGDFNGDGKSDILWRNSSSGLVYEWLLNGAAIISQASVGGAGLDWTIAGVGDFNGDGRSDILWRNTSSGLVYEWLLNGAAIISQASVGGAGLDWTIAGVGDFNGDGRSDILWRNTSSGLVYEWLLNGAGVISQGSVGGAGADWTIARTGDFNGDGKSDILWRNTTSGNVSEWLLNGASIIGQTSPGAATNDWQIQ
jgi:hypothetical protein